jgi:hypothetical protein
MDWVVMEPSIRRRRLGAQPPSIAFTFSLKKLIRWSSYRPLRSLNHNQGKTPLLPLTSGLLFFSSVLLRPSFIWARNVRTNRATGLCRKPDYMPTTPLCSKPANFRNADRLFHGPSTRPAVTQAAHPRRKVWLQMSCMSCFRLIAAERPWSCGGLSNLRTTRPAPCYVGF